jgi:hypothetical protein
MPRELAEDRPGGRALRRRVAGHGKWKDDAHGLRSGPIGGQYLHLAHDRLRLPISVAHEKLSAAVWRFPFRAVRANQNVLTVRRQRAAVRMLAQGATVRQVMKRLRMGPWTVVELRRAVLAWDDPDDTEE